MSNIDPVMKQNRTGAFGGLLIAIRVISMIALLLACLPLYYLWRLLRRRRFWPRVFLAGIGMIAGLNLSVRGRPRRGALFLANHVSWLDIPAIATGSGTAFVAHDGLAANPLLRRLCAMNDTVFVARHRRTSVARQVEELRHALDDTGALTLFPEGTTGNGITLLPFKSALLSAIEPLPPGSVVQPVLLAYDKAEEIAWLGDEPGLRNACRILARWRPVHATLHFLEPREGAALENRKTIAAAAQAAINNAMQDG